MALVVNNEPLDPSANSYVSLAEMVAYLTDRVVNQAYLTAWTRLSADQQARYLVNATRFLDSAVSWIGDRYYRDQQLDWPRLNAYYDGFLLHTTEFPTRVKEACCEMAMWQMENNGAISTGENAQFDKIKVGPIEIDFNEQVGGTPQKYFPDVVAMLLAGYGTVENPDLPGDKRLKQVRLQRA